MTDFNRDTKQHLLGEIGPAIVQEILLSQETLVILQLPINVLDPRVDLIVYPNFPDKEHILEAQIKTKAPWVKARAQSFHENQWPNYQKVDGLFVICAPAPAKYEQDDEWVGHVYFFNPKKVRTIQQTTKSGRRMVLIPLDEHKPLRVIKNQNVIDLMKRFITEED